MWKLLAWTELPHAQAMAPASRAEPRCYFHQRTIEFRSFQRHPSRREIKCLHPVLALRLPIRLSQHGRKPGTERPKSLDNEKVGASQHAPAGTYLPRTNQDPHQHFPNTNNTQPKEVQMPLEEVWRISRPLSLVGGRRHSGKDERLFRIKIWHTSRQT